MDLYSDLTENYQKDIDLGKSASYMSLFCEKAIHILLCNLNVGGGCT